MKFGVIVFPGSNCDHDALYAVRDNLGPAGGIHLARFATAGRRGCRHPARRLLLRRLPALRRHRQVLAGDAGGQALRRRGRAGAGHLQRLPDPGGSRSAARRADPQPRPQVHLPRGAPAGGNRPIRPSPRPPRKGRFCACPSRTAKAATIADERTLDELEAEDRVVFRYLDNPNGSLRDIAGILNRERNVMGMMPHPERATEPLMGSTDGLVVFQSMAAARRCAHERHHHPRTDRAAPADRRRSTARSSTSWAASPATPSWASSA